jgi:hypothetical protein
MVRISPVATASTVALPAPRVTITRPRGVVTVEVPDGRPSTAATTVAATAVNAARIVATDIPQAAIDQGGLVLELLRWVPQRQRNRFGGFVHPTHIAASGNGTFMRGGKHGGASTATQLARPTEWAITAPMDIVDVTQGIFGFMHLGQVSYRDDTATNSTANQTVQLVTSSRPVSNSGMLPKHIAQRGYFVGRFVFRYSIVDLADARQKRVSGPISTVVCAGMAASPFVRANTINFGSGEYATVAVNPAASVGAVSVWHGKAHATRRPL